MNNTTIMSYEENMKDVSRSPQKRQKPSNNDPFNNIKIIKEANEENKRKRNLTQVIDKIHGLKDDIQSVSRDAKPRNNNSVDQPSKPQVN